jgi:CHAT domain-containing protein
MLGMGTKLKLTESMPALANAAKEAEMATDRMGGETALNEDATESAFRQRASAFNILHIASHSILDEGKPLQSHILLHTDPATTDDGRINAWEVYDMKLHADLTVLSACSAGKGRNIRGQGVMSLGRAFSVAGCPNVIMTLNNVDDFAAYQLMDAFYAKLATGMSAADALREARLDYLRDGDLGMAHPSLWAPFILNGPGDVQFEPEPDKGKLIWFMAGSIFVLLAGGAWLLRRLLR